MLSRRSTSGRKDQLDALRRNEFITTTKATESTPPPPARQSSSLSSNENIRNSSSSLDIAPLENQEVDGSSASIAGPSRRGLSAFVVQITAIASLGGILFGYDLGVISGALPQLIETFGLTSRQAEICVSILYLGGGLGAALGGTLCDSFGRKRAILMTDLVFGLGALLLYAAPNFECVVFGRVVVGFAVALSGVADVSYLHEIAPPQFRGAIVSVNEACISLGFLLAFGVGGALSGGDRTDGWRIMFGLSGLVAVVQFFGMLPLPESPKWLAERGRHEESEIALRRINDDYILYRPNEVDETEGTTMTAYQSSFPIRPTQASSSSAAASAGRGAATDDNSVPVMSDFYIEGPRSLTGSDIGQRAALFLCRPVYYYKQLQTFTAALVREYRRQACISLFLAVTQQFCGQANVLSYAPMIFSSASGSAATSQGWSTLSIGLVKFAVTVVVIWKIESIGRRFLLLFGMGTIAVGLFLLAIAFAGEDVKEEEGDEVEKSHGGFYLALPGVLLVVSGYSCSFGPLTWLLTSELFPTDIRGRALGTSTIITYLCASLVTYTFLTAQELVGASVVFSCYLFVTVSGLVFAFLAIPDTGGKAVDEITKELDNMVWWQRRAQLGESGSAGQNTTSPNGSFLGTSTHSLP